MSEQPSFFSELKRRNVYKVAVAYAVVGWVIAQIATQIFPFLEIPNWVVRLVIVLIAIGFPIALVIAWAFETTPEGIKRTEDVDLATAARAPKKHAWIYVAVIGAAISVGLFFIGRFTAGGTAPRQSEAATGLPAKSIAVLPFDNLSRDPDNAYFAEGVQDEILTRLAKVADLKVISRTSTQRFKSSPNDLPAIAKQLGVMHILEGSVQKANDQVRVNVQLINALTDAHLWADTYDRKLVDIFSVESDIAKTIADQLQAKLSGSEKTAMAKQPTANTEAYELYLKGRALWGKRSGDNIPKAIAFFEQAIARDPNYALAYAGLADSYILVPYYTGGITRGDAAPKARAAALKALQLDPNLSEGHAALGKILNFDDIDLPRSVREFQRAIELQPGSATAHHWYGNGPLIALGRFEEAIAEGKKSVELDPLSPVINADYGVTLYQARRYDEAAAQLRKTLEFDPTFFYTHYNLGIVLQLKGDLSGAIAEYEKAKQLSDDPYVLALWGAAKAYAGDKNTALQTLADLDKISQHRDVDAYSRALVYLALNDKPEAIHRLEQDFADHDGGGIAPIKVDPLLDSLHGDPRFEALVQKVVAPK
ncbi:MAG TPA: tetratricopeptide repeat protein [Chthoniobacterales bacterium]|jgi:TolB-like protein|nr:tetratricopeptide repeat protein [Chthoniobacterales bacterium]